VVICVLGGIDPARPWASSSDLRSGVSPVPKCEGPGAPSVRFLGRRDRGRPGFQSAGDESTESGIIPINLRSRAGYAAERADTNPVVAGALDWYCEAKGI